MSLSWSYFKYTNLLVIQFILFRADLSIIVLTDKHWFIQNFRYGITLWIHVYAFHKNMQLIKPKSKWRSTKKNWNPDSLPFPPCDYSPINWFFPWLFPPPPHQICIMQTVPPYVVHFFFFFFTKGILILHRIYFYNYWMTWKWLKLL
jgi:hypothetical protein